MKSLAAFFVICAVSCMAQSAEPAFEAASVRTGSMTFAWIFRRRLRRLRTIRNWFAMTFSKMFGRPVVDGTGLKGRYDFRVDLTALNAANPQDRAGEVDAAMNAMQDQLGVKIENRSRAVDFLVVDHAEKTLTEN
jgi:uncharacterized protein (TIGR03435 family)